MSRPDADLTELERRRAALKAKLAERAPAHDATPSAAAGLGAALKLSGELLAAVFVGVALGYGLSRLFGGTVWFILGGLALGFAAGIRNVVRVARAMQADAEAPAKDDPGRGAS